jgi:Fe2+ transport system protein B
MPLASWPSLCIAREAGSWKWGAFMTAFNTLVAFLLAILVFQLNKESPSPQR